MSALLCALAAVWLTAAARLSEDPCAATILAPTLVAAVVAAAVRKPLRPELAQIALGVGIAGALAMHFAFPVQVPFARLAGYRAFAVLGLVLTAAYLCLHLRASLRRARFLLLVACFFLMALAASPSWALEAALLAAAALLLGRQGSVTAELAALLLLFGAALGAHNGVTAAAALALWAALLLALQPTWWILGAAYAAAAVYCVIGLLDAAPVCDFPALGAGLFCAAAAVEGSR